MNIIQLQNPKCEQDLCARYLRKQNKLNTIKKFSNNGTVFNFLYV